MWFNPVISIDHNTIILSQGSLISLIEVNLDSTTHYEKKKNITLRLFAIATISWPRELKTTNYLITAVEIYRQSVAQALRLGKVCYCHQ